LTSKKKIKINKKHHFASNTPFYFLIYCNVLACMLPIQLVRNFSQNWEGVKNINPLPELLCP
jgi:hypothetical protein